MKLYLFFLLTLNVFLLSHSQDTNDDRILEEILNIVTNKNQNSETKQNQIITYLTQSEFKLSKFKLGYFYYKAGGQFYLKKQSGSAIFCTKKAIITLRGNIDSDSQLYLKKSLSNLALFEGKNNNIYACIKAFKEVLTINGKDKYHAKAYRRLSEIYFEAGDYDRAFEYLDQSQKICKEINDIQGLYFAHSFRASYYIEISPTKYKIPILENLKISDSLIQNLSNKRKALQYSITINLFKGIVYKKVKDYKNAEIFYKKAFDLSKEMGLTTRLSEAQNNLGLIYLAQKDFPKAYELFKKVNDNPNISISQKASINNNLGDYYTALNDFPKAEEKYLNSIKIFSNSKGKVPTLQELELVYDKSSMRDLLEQTADFYYKTYEHTKDNDALQKALQYIKLVDGLIDIIRLENKATNSKLYWRTKGKNLYIKGIKIARLLNNTADAFYFMEKSKVLLLLEDITDEQARTLTNIPENLQNKLFQFKADISILEEDLLYAKTTEKDSVKDILFTTKRKQALFKDSIYNSFPDYARLRKNINIINESEISKFILRDSTAIVSYALNEDEGYCFVKTKHKSHVTKMDSIPHLKNVLNSIQSKLKQPFYRNNDFAYFNKLSTTAYQMLLGKVEHLLGNITHLTIVPDESLAQFPFEILLKSANDSNPSKPDYLFLSKNISYAFSVSHLKALKEIKANAKKGFLGIAPIEFTSTELPSLPNSEDELAAINALFSGDLYLKDKATKTNGIQGIRDHAIIHIASHANYDGFDNSWLWFYDDKLSLSELYGIENNAELVVLNSCKTLQGKEIEGEGVMSLAHGFFVSGSKSVVASLWNSNDNSSKKITSSFYKYLNDNVSKDEALSLAKKDYLKNHSGSELSPYYWASITLTGDTATIQSNFFNSNYIIYVLLTLIVIIATTFLFIKNLKKNKKDSNL